jgi:hypothetical protein
MVFLLYLAVPGPGPDTSRSYFFAVFIASGVYQIGKDQARSWMVAGTPSGGSIPSFGRYE